MNNQTKNTRDEIEQIFYNSTMVISNADLVAEELVPKIEALIEKEVAKATTPTHIMGKPIDEVIMILSALELERIEDLKMTMNNLDEWMIRVRADHHKAIQKAVDRSFERFAQLKEKL